MKMSKKQLDKWNKELAALSKRHYKEMDNELYNFYKNALKELKIEIKNYLERYDELSFSKRLELESQFKKAGRIDEILTELSGKTTQTVSDYTRDELQRGYNGVWYTIEGAENVQLDFGMLPEGYIDQLVNANIDGQNFSARLYQYRNQLAERATSALLDGAVRGVGYRKVAKLIGDLTEANYKQALRIARTEGGRVQSTAKQKAYEEAKDKGVDIQKQWMSTLDQKTRDTHQSLDGQTVDIEDEFESESGNKAKGPKLFGVASEDVNCRCTTLTIVNGISPKLRRDNETGEVIKYQNYEEWAKAKGYNDPKPKKKAPKKSVKPKETVKKKPVAKVKQAPKQAPKESQKPTYYTAKQIDAMSEKKLLETARELSLKYHASGKTGISYGGRTPEQVTNAMLVNQSKAALRKDIKAMQRALKKWAK